MNRILERARQQAWDQRAEYGRDAGPARDRWCVHRLMRAGHLAPAQHAAAVRLSRLLERAAGQTASGGSGEAVDGGGGDPHARMWDASVCAREAECARAAVMTNLPPADRGLRIHIFDLAMEFPHRSTPEAMAEAGLAHGGKQHAAFIAHLQTALDLLAIYFDAVDAAVARQARSA